MSAAESTFPMSSSWPAWHCLGQADAGDPSPAQRLPWHIGGQRVGSIASQHVAALLRLAPSFHTDAVGRLHCGAPEHLQEAALALREAGLLSGWRSETYAVRASAGGPVLAKVERAACFFFGFLTEAAHATGYVHGPDRRVQGLWIAQRSLSKATDPGKFDNLVGGGIPFGQSAQQAFVREAWEEAGLREADLTDAGPRGTLLTRRPVPQGWQHELLHVFDIPLPAGWTPCNQDGEVAGVRLMPIALALALARSDAMTIDAALVTLDFALRHHLLDEAEARAAEAAMAPLRWSLR
jgi:8-oxo-dGTP pyrophosphatase MutT (NUDIX family)